ncbi:MAG: right-handed parallel beta-helix repeat-containing protein [Candidatus Bathyarchaeales archaeon]
MKTKVLAFILIAVLPLALILAFENGKAQFSNDNGIIRIRSDGTVEGTDKIHRNGNLYTLTGNLTSYVNSNEAFIFLERDNIIFDGAGYTVKGTGYGTAIYMLRRQNVTVKNFNIIDFETGINFWTVRNWPSDSKFWGLPPAQNNQILNNTITVKGIVSGTEAGWAIYLQEAIGTLISGNTITSQDPKGGIFFGFTTGKTSLLNNTFVACGLYIRDSNQTIAFGNTVDGKPLVLLDGASNQVINDAGLVYLFNCKNIIIKEVHFSVDYGKTVQLVGSKNIEVTNCEGYITLIDSENINIHDNSLKSIELLESHYNKITQNTVITNGVCINIVGPSSHNDISENTLLPDFVTTATFSPIGTQAGIYLALDCKYNDIRGNNILNHSIAIACSASSLNNIYSNNIINCNMGIILDASNQNRIFQNSIEKCGYAIKIVGSNNSFYHNNFIENEHQVSISHQTLFSSDIIIAYSIDNTFDLGYPAGGNYWSDYDGADANNDGIGDTPYIVYENYTDRYPLMKPVVLEIAPLVVDASPPSISIISPENKTYSSRAVNLIFTLSEKALWMGYSIDGQYPKRITENTTLSNLSCGSHNITVYAIDKIGNRCVSETISFTITEETGPEPFNIALFAVASIGTVATMSVALFVFFKKRKHYVEKVLQILMFFMRREWRPEDEMFPFKVCSRVS